MQSAGQQVGPTSLNSHLLYLNCMIMNTVASDRWVICCSLYDNSAFLKTTFTAITIN